MPKISISRKQIGRRRVKVVERAFEMAACGHVPSRAVSTIVTEWETDPEAEAKLQSLASEAGFELEFHD